MYRYSIRIKGSSVRAGVLNSMARKDGETVVDLDIQYNTEYYILTILSLPTLDD